MTTTATVENVSSVQFPTYQKSVSGLRSSHAVGASVVFACSALALLALAVGNFGLALVPTGLALLVGVPRRADDGVRWSRVLPGAQLVAMGVTALCQFVVAGMVNSASEAPAGQGAGFSAEAGFDSFFATEGSLVPSLMSTVDVVGPVLSLDGSLDFWSLLSNSGTTALALVVAAAIVAGCFFVASALTAAIQSIKSFVPAKSAPTR